MRNDFYSLSQWEQEEHALRCQVHFEAQHRIFKGHFPGHPVVPGVCTIALVKDCLEEALGVTLLLRESSSVKFLGLILPEARPLLKLSWTEQDGVFQAQASLQGEKGVLFKMSGSYVQLQKAALQDEADARMSREG